MEIVAKKVDNANAEVNAKIAKSDIESKTQKIAKELSKTLNLPGFRKGKVPIAIVKKRYGEKIEKDAEAEALQEVYAKALEELGLNKEDILGEPAVTKFDKKDEVIETEIKISFRPEIDLEGYEEAIPEFKEPEVSDEEVEKRLKELAEAMTPPKKLEEDRPLQEGDIAIIDFKGYVDDKEIEGGSAENFQLKIGSGQFIPGFEEQLVGMKAGESKTIEVTFPEDYHNKELAGKKAKFDVTLKEIQVKEEPKIDDELAKKMLPNEENPTVDLLKEKIKEQIKSEKLSKLYNEELKPKLIENLVEKFDFDLPENIVEQEIDIKLNEKLRGMSEDELKELRENPDKVKELRESLKDEAKKSVKATFIVDALAKKEGIKVDDQEVIQTIYYEAMQMGQNPQEVLEAYKKQGLLPAIKMAMIEDKLLTHLLNKKLEAK
ncbi:trigger factor [Nitrosophilus kaiyonis]|uniref:trigger factor n=1 Tax=Nitrosophilus kaiyonis TaxID=2930200 RepID=UPI0024936234|nr:trigger factor [Nitrosophilus kaiyonis]